MKFDLRFGIKLLTDVTQKLSLRASPTDVRKGCAFPLGSSQRC